VSVDRLFFFLCFRLFFRFSTRVADSSTRAAKAGSDRAVAMRAGVRRAA